MASKSTNSPDLAFPIEDLWAIIKPRIKRREPQTIEELKSYILQEWNSVPKELIRNQCNSFIDRVKKVIELNGARLEPEHLKKKKIKKKYINGKFLKHYLNIKLFIMIIMFSKQKKKK